MKKNIELKIISKSNPYEYRGICNLNKDLMEFNDSTFDYIFDFKMNRLIKEKKDYKLIIDFKEEMIDINSDGLSVYVPFEIDSKKIDIIDVDIKYQIKEDNINLVIKEV